MAERRRNKKKKEDPLKDIGEKPSKEEYAVARFLKQKLPEKKTTLLGHKVEYFIACKAVDLLADSKWAKENKKGELSFANRDVAIDFMARLLEHKFFHRAKKIVVQKEIKKKKKDEESTEKEATPKEKDAKKSPKEKTEVSEDKECKKEGGEVSEKKKEKKKIKLDMHLEQMFVDSNEPYVWIYDPIPIRTWIIGSLMVVAAVLLCLFPLWPQTIRHYIYYLSVAAAFFLVFIIGLAVLRLVVFVLVWVFTLGRHHLWLLPNLTEDVGFFESFWPLYKYDYKGPKKEDDKDKEEQDDTCKKSQEGEEEEKDDKEVEDNPHEDNEEEKEDNTSEEEGQKTENGFEFIEAVDEESEDSEDPKDK
ncbi:hypothetical protein JTE90_017378 [Oedothorax gibbosus]|uniref:Translocation protein SEC62 n=1 Tax=Oedothorax gibbosus TaxID=931172 RepID=A0AAV6VRX5_9ARAC|nr:hypothetical protein JTE90_017378 [Oedothorax gibbosus]